MLPKHNESEEFDIQLSSEPKDDCKKNNARKEINVERRRNGLRSHYGNDNDDGTEKRNALLTTMLTFEEASATKTCNKSTFAGTRSSTNTKHIGITTSSSVKAPTMFSRDAVLRNKIDLSNDDLAVNAPLLKQQGIIRQEHVNHRRPSLTVASKDSRKFSSFRNQNNRDRNCLEIPMENELIESTNEVQLDNGSFLPLTNSNLASPNIGITENDELNDRFVPSNWKDMRSYKKLDVIIPVVKNHSAKASDLYCVFDAPSQSYRAKSENWNVESSEQVLPYSCFEFSTKRRNSGQRYIVPPPIVFVPILMPPVINPSYSLLSLIRSHISFEKEASRTIETDELTKINKLKNRFKRKNKNHIARSATLSKKIILRRGSKFVPRHHVKADLHRIKRRRRNFLCNWFENIIKYSTATLGRKLDTFGDKHNYKYFPSATVHKMVHGFDPIERKIEHEDGAGERNIVPSCMEYIRQSYALQCKIGSTRKSSDEDIFTVPKDKNEDDLDSNTFSRNNDFIYVIVGLTNILIIQFIMVIVIFFVKE